MTKWDVIARYGRAEVRLGVVEAETEKEAYKKAYQHYGYTLRRSTALLVSRQS